MTYTQGPIKVRAPPPAHRVHTSRRAFAPDWLLLFLLFGVTYPTLRVISARAAVIAATAPFCTDECFTRGCAALDAPPALEGMTVANHRSSTAMTTIPKSPANTLRVHPRRHRGWREL